MSEALLTFDAADRLVGHTDVTGWLTVDREHLRSFTHASYLEPEHVDLTTSRNHALGDDLVDGFLLLSLLVYFDFAYPMMNNSGGGYGYNYGLDRVRFTAPVFVGNQVRLRRTVADVQVKSPTRRRITVDIEMESDGAQTPVMYARWIMLAVHGDAEAADDHPAY